MTNRFALFVPLLIPVLLLGCGSLYPKTHVTPPRLLFVADAMNNRLLIYESPFASGESASTVLGQSNFTSFGPGVSATALDNPVAAAMDASGNLYVTDQGNCRVLQYKPTFATGMAATLAIGQADLNSNACLNAVPATAAGLGTSPSGLAIDSSGNLWVADSYYSRVLKYPTPLTTGEAATVALGQLNLTGAGAAAGCNQPGGGAPAPNTLCSPGGLAFDSGGNLWVVDSGNNRILKYPQANLVTGGSATVVLGQPAFNSNTPNTGGVSASTLSLPVSGMAGIAFDSSRNLWVADISNHRVLMYPVASLGTNGAPATLELGQPAGTNAFTSNSPNNPTLGASSLSHPVGLAFDGSGNLYVGDSGNSRTLEFAPLFSNGMNAGVVLGQANFTSMSGTTTSTGQDAPQGVATTQ